MNFVLRTRLAPVRGLAEHAVLRGGGRVHDGALRPPDRGAPAAARRPLLLRADGAGAVRHGRHDHGSQGCAGHAV